MALLFLATLAAQIGSAFFNSVRGKRLSEELAEKQRAYEEKATREGIENAKAEFAEWCEFQRSIEAEMQRDRLELIKSNHQKTLMLEAYGSSLENWPLLVPPYVLKNDSIFSLGPTERQPIPLNCILTTSTDGNFNSAVFYKLEENLAEFCSKYWNIATAKSIRFLQNTWRDNVTDIASKHKNLYAHLKDIPTLVLSPIIRDNKLIFRFYWWGLSLNPAEAHIDENNELDPELNIAVSRNMQYDDATIQTILSECTPKLEAFISFFADMYYWNFYGTPPLLPSLIKNGVTLIGVMKDEFMYQYEELLENSISDKMIFNAHPERIIYQIESLPNISDKRSNCLKIWKKRFLKGSDKEERLINALLDLNLYSKQDIPFLMALANVFPEYNKAIMKLSESLNTQRFTQALNISKEQKYNRQANNSCLIVEEGIDKKETPKRLSKYNF